MNSDSTIISIKDKHLNMDTLENQLNMSLDRIKNFYQNMENLPIRPNLKPGEIYEKLRKNLPMEPERFEAVLNEFEDDIFPNMCLWHHPKFFAYFGAPTSNSAITLEMIATAFNTPNFNWNVSPAAHELEWVVMDWMRKFLGLDEKFSFENGGCGGCPMTTTEGSFLSVNLAKYKKIKQLELSEFDCRRLKFVGYYPLTNKDWAEKALKLNGLTQLRCLNVYYTEETGNYNIKPDELYDTIRKDIDAGLIPLWYGGQIGSTYSCATCQIDKIGPILKEFGIYFNIDAAHAGMFLMLPETKIKGLEYVNNLSLNMAKTGLSGLQGALMFNDDKENLILSTGAIDGEIYKTGKTGIKIDYKDFTVGFSKRLVGLKLYGMLKTIGVSGYQEYLRIIINRGNYFLNLLQQDSRFELFTQPAYGLICFRLKPLGDESMEAYNQVNNKLQSLMDINTEEGLVSSASINGMKFMRFVSANPLTEVTDIDKIWEKIQKSAESVL